jgi:UDP-N-acetylmuramate dehydrogenase
MRSPDSAVPLAPFTTLGVGGPARWFAEAASIDDVRQADGWAHDRGVEMVILAGGSNVVVSDEGVGGLVLRVCAPGISQVLDGDEVVVKAGAGETWDSLVEWAVTQGLSASNACRGFPAPSAARRFRTSAPTGRTCRRRSRR